MDRSDGSGLIEEIGGTVKRRAKRTNTKPEPKPSRWFIQYVSLGWLEYDPEQGLRIAKLEAATLAVAIERWLRRMS